MTVVENNTKGEANRLYTEVIQEKHQKRGKGERIHKQNLLNQQQTKP